MLPTLNIAVRVEIMARHVPSQAGNETSEDFETLFVSFTLINSRSAFRFAVSDAHFGPHYVYMYSGYSTAVVLTKYRVQLYRSQARRVYPSLYTVQYG